MSYKQVASIFKEHVLIPLRKTLLEKVDVNTRNNSLEQNVSFHENELTPELIPFRLCLTKELDFSKDKVGYQKKEAFDIFLSLLQKERQYTPPVRLLFAGSDLQFHFFMIDYVTSVLHIQAHIIETQKNDSEEPAQ